MITVKTRDIVRRPSILNQKEPVLIIDGTTKKPKSVVVPFDLYEKIRDIVESELFLARNADLAQSSEAKQEFLERESALLEDVSA